MLVLVTGAAGLIGSQVIKELTTRGGFQIRALSRDPSRIIQRWGNKIEAMQGNVLIRREIDRACEGCDAVIHAVQFPNHPVERPSKGWTYLNVDGQGTVNTVHAAMVKGIKRFIYISGAGVREGRREDWFRAKWRAEQAVIAGGIPYTIFRPSWIYGPRDRSLNRFIKMVKYLPVIPVIGSGRNTVQPISVFDVARVIADSLTNVKAANRIFELGGPETLTMREVIGKIEKALNKRRLIVPHPKLLMKLIAFFMSALPNPPLSPHAIDFVTMQEPVDPSAALEVFGGRFDTMEDAFKKYAEHR